MQNRHKIPRYQELSIYLRQGIENGNYKFGVKLPSETELCRTYGVSRGTAVKAIEQLVLQGIAIRKQGTGTFVARPSLQRKTAKLQSFSEGVARQGKVATQKILSIKDATETHCKSFGCFESCKCIVRLRLVNGITTSLHTSLIPKTIIESFSQHEQDNLKVDTVSEFSLYEAFESAGHPVNNANERVSSRLISKREAEVLSVVLPAAVTVVFRTSFNQTGRLIEASEAIYLSDFYSYEVNLARGVANIVSMK